MMYDTSLDDGDRSSVYLDGIEYPADSYSSNSREPAAGTMVLGRLYPDTEPGEPAVALIDDLIMWNRLLSPEEIADLANGED